MLTRIADIILILSYLVAILCLFSISGTHGSPLIYALMALGCIATGHGIRYILVGGK